MAPRTGNSGQLTEKRRGDRVALLGEGSEEEPPPTPLPHRPVFRLRVPAQPMLQRGGGPRGHVPRHGVRCTGSAQQGSQRAGGRAGSRVGPGRIWARATRAAVQRGSHASAAQPRASRPGPPACPPQLAKGRPPRVPPLRQTEKLPRLGREPGRAAACGWARRSSSRLCAGGAGVGRKPQTRAACRGSPPPFAGDSEARPSCGGGARPATAQREPTPS